MSFIANVIFIEESPDTKINVRDNQKRNYILIFLESIIS